MNKGRLYWITGLSGAGKTTIGTALYYKLKEQYDNIVLLDGDILKNIFENEQVQYTESARRTRAFKYARLCKTLVDQGIIVVCCTIAMYDEVRAWNREEIEGYIEVFLDVPMEVLIQRDQKGLYSGYQSGTSANVAGMDVQVEFPKTPDLVICNDGKKSVADCVNEISNLETQNKRYKIADEEYWNAYYSKDVTPHDASDFACYVLENYLKKSYRLLELGCGNGRDSLFFHKNGIQVVGVDSAQLVIDKIREQYKSEDILFVCDDFTRTNTLYQQQFDYCYSRFTLHAVNEQQEIQLIKNVNQCLKRGSDKGYFFIEVRSVKDEIYGLGEKLSEDEYIYEGHYRRFARKEKLEQRLQENEFKVVYSEESRGFAKFKDTDPIVLRIVAKV